MSLSCTPSVIETVLSWTHNGIDLHEDENTTFLPVNLNHDLILDNTVIDDSGRYTCRAVLNDEVVEQNITVTVVPGMYICSCEYTYVTVFWKTDHLRPRIKIHLLPIHDRQTHALSRNIKYQTIVCQVCFCRQLFLDAVKPQGCISWS